jgi:hypothetical protein
VRICNQITLLILYYICSRLITLLKLNDAPTKVSDILYFFLRFKFINFSFQILLPFFPEMSIASNITWFRLPTSIWFRSSNTYILFCFDLKILTILHQAMVYNASLHTELFSL